MKQPTLGFIGFGKMASILAEGALRTGFVRPSSIRFNRRDRDKASVITNDLGITFSTLEDVIKHSEFIFLAIKPQQFHELSTQIKPFLHKKSVIISIMAGHTIETISQALGQFPIARVMPNTPALLGEGISAITFSQQFHPPEKAFVRSFFESVGKVIEIPESAHSSATAISGCGPAFFYAIADAIAETGQSSGLSYEQSLSLCAQTLIGAGHMLLESGKQPKELIKDVASPQGATQAGLDTLSELDIPQHMQEVIRSALKRSIELGTVIKN